MAVVNAFAPGTANTVSISYTTSSARVAVQAGSANRHIRVYNAGGDVVYVESGGSGVVATVPSGATGGSLPIPAGAVEIIGAPHPYIAAIGVGSGVIYLTPGEGI